MVQKKSLKKNYLYNLIYQFVLLFTPVIVTPYISRTIGVEGIGIYSYTLAIAVYFADIGALGVGTHGQLEVSKSRNGAGEICYTFSKIVFAKCFTMIPAILMYLLFIMVSCDFKKMYFVLLTFLIAQLFDITWLFQGLEEFGTISLLNTIIKIGSVACIFVFVKDSTDLYLYVLLIQGSTLIKNILLCIKARKYVALCPVAIKDIRETVKKNLIYFIPSIASIVFASFDKLMLGIMSTTMNENGYYEQASKIYNLLIALITSTTVVILPRVANYWNSDSKDESEVKGIIYKAISYTGLIAFPVAFGLITVSRNFVNIFMGDGYEKCVPLLQVFSCILIFTSFNSILSNSCMVARGQQRKLNILIVISTLINICLNCVLITMFKSMGAVVASALSEAILLTMIVYSIKDVVKVKTIINCIYLYIVSALIMAIAVRFVDILPINVTLFKLIIQILIGIICYGIVLYAFRDKLLNEFLKLVARKLNDK